jgi:hypothetical protein
MANAGPNTNGSQCKLIDDVKNISIVLHLIRLSLSLSLVRHTHPQSLSVLDKRRG